MYIYVCKDYKNTAIERTLPKRIQGKRKARPATSKPIEMLAALILYRKTVEKAGKMIPKVKYMRKKYVYSVWLGSFIHHVDN